MTSEGGTDERRLLLGGPEPTGAPVLAHTPTLTAALCPGGLLTEGVQSGIYPVNDLLLEGFKIGSLFTDRLARN